MASRRAGWPMRMRQSGMDGFQDSSDPLRLRARPGSYHVIAEKQREGQRRRVTISLKGRFVTRSLFTSK